MSIFAPFSSLITLLNIINMRMEKSILDILGMSLFQTTLSDFWEGLKFRMQKSGSGEVRLAGFFPVTIKMKIIIIRQAT